MYIDNKEQENQDSYTVFENIYLINYPTYDEAMVAAEVAGKSSEGDESGSLTVDGKPAVWVFAGVRKIVEVDNLCIEPGDNVKDCIEITYNEYIVNSKLDITMLANGENTIINHYN